MSTDQAILLAVIASMLTLWAGSSVLGTSERKFHQLASCYVMYIHSLKLS